MCLPVPLFQTEVCTVVYNNERRTYLPMGDKTQTTRTVEFDENAKCVDDVNRIYS